MLPSSIESSCIKKDRLKVQARGHVKEFVITLRSVPEAGYPWSIVDFWKAILTSCSSSIGNSISSERFQRLMKTCQCTIIEVTDLTEISVARSPADMQMPPFKSAWKSFEGTRCCNYRSVCGKSLQNLTSPALRCTKKLIVGEKSPSLLTVLNDTKWAPGGIIFTPLNFGPHTCLCQE